MDTHSLRVPHCTVCEFVVAPVQVCRSIGSMLNEQHRYSEASKVLERSLEIQKLQVSPPKARLLPPTAVPCESARKRRHHSFLPRSLLLAAGLLPVPCRHPGLPPPLGVRSALLRRREGASFRVASTRSRACKARLWHFGS